MGIAEGMVAIAHENTLAEYSRLYQFAKSVRNFMPAYMLEEDCLTLIPGTICGPDLALM